MQYLFHKSLYHYQKCYHTSQTLDDVALPTKLSVQKSSSFQVGLYSLTNTGLGSFIQFQQNYPTSVSASS